MRSLFPATLLHVSAVLVRAAEKGALLLSCLAMLLACGTTTVQGQSAFDGFDPNANGLVQIVVVQPDGKILIGGDFTTLSPNGGATVTRNHIARLNVDGTLDIAFNPNADHEVLSIAVQADGKILVGGWFEGIGGQTRNHIARLDATTGLADSWDPNANRSVTTIAVQTDGKILVGGDFQAVNSIGGQTRSRIARLDPITGLADSWDPNAGGLVYSIAIQPDGKILVAGYYDGIGGQPRRYLGRLDPLTGLADSFDPQPNNFVKTIAIQADGRILAGGGFTNIGGQTHHFIARLDATVGLADSFDANADGRVIAIAVQADGKILSGGEFTSIGGEARNRIARLSSTTGLADSFDPNATGLNVSPQIAGAAKQGVTPDTPPPPTATPAPQSGIAIAVQADGKILVGGGFTTLAPNGGTAVTRNRIARLETDGRVDQALISNVNTVVYSTAVQPDGKILIGGSFTTVLGVARNNIARLNTDGTLDTAFNPNANFVVYSFAVQTDGKILAGGAFASIGGQPRNGIARLDSTTGLADFWDPHANNGAVLSIAVQADGKILVGGQFDAIGGQARNRIARLDTTTGLADSFNPNANDQVETVIVQADGKILAGGEFNSIGGQARNHIARLDAITGVADSFNPNANSIVHSIAVQANGSVLVGGDFISIGGQPRNHIARLDATTGLADSFDPNAGGFVNTKVFSIAVQADSKILVGGRFTSIGGQTRNSVARLNATTGSADLFNPDANNDVSSIAVQADGKVLVGGSFSTIGGQTRGRFARLTNGTAALQNLVVTQTTLTWARGGSSPQFTKAAFEYSNDNVSYNPLGNAVATGSDWTLTGLSLSTGQNFYIRARGLYQSGGRNGSESMTESVWNAFLLATPTVLGNISTRLRVEIGDNALIGGFIVTGMQSKKIIVRAIGPSLPFGGVLVDPILELRDSSGELIRSNDNWRSDQEQEIIDTGIPPANDSESAVVAMLPANGSAYTAIVRGVNDGTGVGLVEVYDLDQTVDSKLANISTRGLVQTGDNAMIAGTIVLGQASQRVLVRAIGPSLPVEGKLVDPILELRDGNGALIRANDNWRSDQETEITATGISPTNDLESALVETVSASGAAYTAIVRGMNDTTGVALVEIYGLTN